MNKDVVTVLAISGNDGTMATEASPFQEFWILQVYGFMGKVERLLTLFT